MTAPAPPTSAIHGSFVRSWTAEVLTAPPLIRPARHYTYPREVAGEEDAMARGSLELMVRPAAGAAFLATCWTGFKSASLPSGVWSCPDPRHMCAVTGGYAFVVDTTAPEQAEQVSLRPVVSVRPLEEEGLLLFAGFTHIVAWGRDGLLWQTGRLSWEGLTLHGAVAGRLHGTGWDMLSDRELPFSIDLRTGAHEGGGYRLPSGSSG